MDRRPNKNDSCYQFFSISNGRYMLNRALYQEDLARWEAIHGKSGTQRSSSFKSKPNRDNPNVMNHYFNTPGDGAAHGHVQEVTNPDGTTSYPFARDVEGDTYDTR